jgi:hypothetical protein
MIEFERALVGTEFEHGGEMSRPYSVNVSDIMDMEPLGGDRTRIHTRSRGPVIANASYERVRKLISIVRNQMGSLIEGDA